MESELTLAWWRVAATVLAAVVTTAVAVAAICRRAAGSRPAGPEPVVPVSVSPDLEETETLTEGLIGAFDLASSCPAVRAHVQQVLRRVGVVPLEVPPGSLFDPAVHLAVETEPAGAGQSDRVARQVRPGWSRRGTLVRPGEVVVWTAN